MTLPTQEIKDLLNQVMAEIDLELSGGMLAPRNPKTGKAIKFNIPKGKNLYCYFRGRDKNDYCYTPHADVDGYYYSWAYIGVGSRTGKAKRWTLKFLRSHRKRKDAKSRAIKLRNASNKST